MPMTATAVVIRFCAVAADCYAVPHTTTTATHRCACHSISLLWRRDNDFVVGNVFDIRRRVLNLGVGKLKNG